MRARVWVRTLDYLVESCWLLAIVAVPIFFDTETTRIFEPDKIALFRNIVLVMLVALLLRGLITLPAALAGAGSPSPADRERGQGSEGDSADGATAETARGAARPWWRRALTRDPMLVPVIIFTAIYTLATVHSVLPGIAFWGSYDRMQGLYTWLTYIAFFFVLAYRIRAWPQIERVISAIVFASVPVAIYGVMQHLGWDPVVWGADTHTRVASTLGNAIFIGAYLLMCLPFTAYRFWRAIERFRDNTTIAPAIAAPLQTSNGRGRSSNGMGRPAAGRTTASRPAGRSPQRDGTITISGLPPIVPLIGYALVLMVSFAALYFSGSRGPYYGFLAGSVFVFGLAITLKTANPYPAMGAMVLDIVLVAFPYIVNVLPPVVALLILLILVVCGVLLALRVVKLHPALAIAGAAIAILVFVPAVDVVNSPPATAAATASSTSSSSASADAAHLTNPGGADTQVRFFIWQGTKSLVTKGGIGKFLLGYGPESMIYVYAPYYPSGLGHLERSNAAPDRNHDVWLDFIVFSGVIGLLAWLGVLASFAYALYKAWRRPITRRATVVLAAVAGVVVGHLVESSVGIPVVSTLMLLWTTFALAAVFYLRPELGAAGLDVVAAAETVAASVGVPAATGATVAAGRSGNGRNRGATATTTRPRRAQAAPPVARGGSFERLNGRQQGGFLGAILVGLAATVGACFLFANNVQVVQADAVYKTAQAYDSVGAACLTRAVSPTDPAGQSCPAGQATQQQILNAAGNAATGQGFIPTAISLYQQAISDQPSQDMYYLWLGKAYLDESRYYLILKQQADTIAQNPKQPAQTRQAATQQSAQALQNVVQQYQSAEHVLKQAAALNPYNADHPMNLARMFTSWALYIDPSQWANADAYYKKATGLALHNGRWWDEWAYADIQQAARPGIALAQQRTVLTHAIAEANHACQVDDLLGDARVYRGDAEQQLAAITTNATQKHSLLVRARDSYVEALKIGGFEVAGHSPAQVLQRLISIDAELGDFKALVTPLQAPDANGAPATGTPMTLAYSSTYALNGPTSPFSVTLQAISNTLRQKGLVK